jgi:hypothetical protein
MRRSLKNMVVFVAVSIAVIWLLLKLNILPSSKDLFSEKPVQIDETPMLLKEIKSIAQLVTVTAFDEVVVDSVIRDNGSKIGKIFNPLSPYPFLPVDKKIVLIGRGKVLAGTDLTNLKEGDIQVVKDTITLKLNRAVILDAIINPSDFETFDEQGKWTDAEVRAVKLRARQKIIERAIQHNILRKADVKAKSVMENFLLSSGYKKVNLITE